MKDYDTFGLVGIISWVVLFIAIFGFTATVRELVPQTSTGWFFLITGIISFLMAVISTSISFRKWLKEEVKNNG